MSDPIFVSVGGGKGGVGKSTVAANLGSILSKKGFSVVLSMSTWAVPTFTILWG